MSHEPVKERQIKIMQEGGATSGPIVMDWDMLKEVDAFLKDHPDSFKAWVARGILYFNEDFEKAIESLSHALAIDPFNGDQYYNRGRKFLSQDRYPQALADLTYYKKGDYFSRQGEVCKTMGFVSSGSFRYCCTNSVGENSIVGYTFDPVSYTHLSFSTSLVNSSNSNFVLGSTKPCERFFHAFPSALK